MKQVSLASYFQNISDIMTQTEEMGAKMNPSYEEIVKAMEEDTLSDELLAKVHTIFEEGVEAYQQKVKSLRNIKAPVKLMGLHQNFLKAYEEYVEGCTGMYEAVDPERGFNKELFHQSEIKQDEMSQKMMGIIARMTKFAK